MRRVKHHDESYLSRLQFDPKLNEGFLSRFLSNIRIVVLLVIAILALGIYGYFNLPRRLNPEIKIPIVTVVTILLGASPKDVESLITIPLENSLGAVAGIDTTNSSSVDNVSIITIQFFSNVDREKARGDVQSAIDTVNILPTDAINPSVKVLDFEDQPVWTFALSSKGGTASLMREANDLKQKLENIPQIDRVNLSGFDTQEIHIVVSQSKIDEFGLNPMQLSSALKSALNSFPAGTVGTAGNSFSLTIDPSITDVADIRDLQVSANGTQFRLGDIADVSEASKQNQTYSFLADHDTNGKRIVVVNVFKTLNSNID